MKKNYLSSWRQRLSNAEVNEPLFTDSPSASVCDAWRARIEVTLLVDLSEEERSSLSEHTKWCSACAGRLREYQAVEEFAGELPFYDLVHDETRTSPPEKRCRGHECENEVKQQNMSRIILTLLASMSLLTLLASVITLIIAAIRSSPLAIATHHREQPDQAKGNYNTQDGTRYHWNMYKRHKHSSLYHLPKKGDKRRRDTMTQDPVACSTRSSRYMNV